MAAASTLSSSHLPFPGRWCLQLAAPVGGCRFYYLLIPPPFPRRVMFAAGCPCWWLPLLLPSHPTSLLWAGGARSCPPLLVAAASSTVLSHLPSDSGRVVLAAGCPCWWLPLLLPSHPTSPPRAGGACSWLPLLVAAASTTFASHFPFLGR